MDEQTADLIALVDACWPDGPKHRFSAREVRGFVAGFMAARGPLYLRNRRSVLPDELAEALRAIGVGAIAIHEAVQALRSPSPRPRPQSSWMADRRRGAEG